MPFVVPSSCLLEARWDWADGPVSGKIGNTQEVYRYKRPLLHPLPDEQIDTGNPLIVTKTKIRGKGRALNLKFTSPPGYDCQLLGWSILYTGNTTP
jgi:hypothetical protein